MQELQNSYLAHICNTAARRSFDYIRKKSMQARYLVLVRKKLESFLVAMKIAKRKKTGEQMESDLLNVLPPVEHEMDRKVKEAKNKRYKKTDEALGKHIRKTFQDALSKKERMNKLTTRSKINSDSIEQFLLQTWSSVARIESVGFDKTKGQTKKEMQQTLRELKAKLDPRVTSKTYALKGLPADHEWPELDININANKPELAARIEILQGYERAMEEQDTAAKNAATAAAAAASDQVQDENGDVHAADTSEQADKDNNANNMSVN